MPGPYTCSVHMLGQVKEDCLRGEREVREVGGHFVRHCEDKKKRGVRIRWLSGKSKRRQETSTSHTTMGLSPDSAGTQPNPAGTHRGMGAVF